MKKLKDSGGEVRFGPFEVNLRTGELRKHGLKIRLQDQPFQILAMLLEDAGDVITREELRQKLWPEDTFVDFDHGLNNAINRLREALNDSSEHPRYVETLLRRGYRFIALVESIPVSMSPTAFGQATLTGEVQGPIASDHATPVEGAITPKWRAYFKRLWLILGLLTGLAAVLFGLNVGRYREHVLARRENSRIQSVAVLPLENLSGDPSQEYFADGMTDSLTTDLAQYGALRVISRTSAMLYKNARKPLPQIARELNVDAVVEGSVTRSGNRVRITAQLIRASSDRHLWAQTYERDLKDVLRLQSEISRDIADQVEIKLSAEGTTLRLQPPQVNPDAFELYLKGRFYLAKRTKEDMAKAAEYFEQAARKDPKSALAYAGLADAYSLLSSFGFLQIEESIPRAKAAATKALALDDTLPEALTAMAGLTDDDAESERLFRRAIEVNPGYAQAHHWYARFLRDQGRLGEAVAEIEMAQALDPLSLIVNVNVGEIYFDSRQYDKAIEQLNRTLALNPNFGRTHVDLGQAYEKVGRRDEAIAEFQKSRELADNFPEWRIPLQHAYEKRGYLGYYQAQLELLKERSRRQPIPMGRLAYVYLVLGDKGRAIATLEKEARKNPSALNFLRTDPEYDDLRSDPRFAEVLRRIESPTVRKKD